MKVPIEELHRLVRLLANQMPVRYYLRAGSEDNPYSHMRLELWFHLSDRTKQIDTQLDQRGFLYESDKERRVQNYRVMTYICERDWDVEKAHGYAIQREGSCETGQADGTDSATSAQDDRNGP